MKDLKYCRVTNISVRAGCAGTDEQLKEIKDTKRSGVYMWINVFDGDLKYPSEIENLEDYDVLHVNVCGGDLGVIQDLRERLPNSTSTKIVANLDYSPEEAQKTLVAFPTTYRREIKGADYYFGTEYYSASFLYRLTGKQTAVIPHPVDIKSLSEMEKVEPHNMISSIYHGYDDQIDLPYWIISEMGMSTGILGLPADQRTPRGNIVKILYDFPMKDVPWEDWVKLLQKNKILYEPYTQHSYGRATAEAAALGIPTVGSHLVDSMRRCFPDLICDPSDVMRARSLIAKVRDDPEFYSFVSAHARDNSRYYSFDNCKKLFERMIE